MQGKLVSFGSVSFAKILTNIFYFPFFFMLTFVVVAAPVKTDAPSSEKYAILSN